MIADSYRQNAQDNLFSLLNLDFKCCEQRKKFNVERIRNTLRNDPTEARHKHRFDAAGGESMYPIFMAISLGAPIDIIQIMYSACPKALGETTFGGWTPLHLAVRSSKDSDVVDFLLQKCPSQARRKNRTAGYTPLHVACMSGAPLEIIRHLTIHNPAALLDKDCRGCTPLHYACRFGASEEVVRHLVALCRRSLREKSAGGLTPLHAACAGGASPELVEMLVSKDWRACGERDSSGWTPLHHACYKGAPTQVYRLLLERNMEAIGTRNNLGKTPLEAMGDISPDAMATLQAAADFNTISQKNDDEAVRLWRRMSEIGWQRGMDFLLDARPSLLHKLHMDYATVPSLFAKVGQDHHLHIMFSLMSGMPDVLSC